ncbi:hypothetical protein FZW96_15060 [Bacillus sp. BGMRC 2118]|nr:hypothetical protein FZW96_15060 [Bacillus sp. BGMRC 2118]
MYKLVADDSLATLRIPAHSLLVEDIHQKHVTLKYGLRSSTVRVVPDHSLPYGEMILSHSIVHELSIPLQPLYQVRVNRHDEIVLGPYIGILATISSEKLSRNISSLTSYLHHYHEIGGSIIVFSLEGVDQERKQVAGYLYHPSTKSWLKGTYPYPSSIFSIVEASLTEHWNYYQTVMQHFQATIGDRLYNYPNFNKWDMYNMLKHEFQNHLPDTAIYQTPITILKMLEKHKSIYIKPINGRLGRLVYKVDRTKNGAIVQYGGKGKQRKKYFSSQKQFMKFFYHRLKEDDYLIQKSIQLLSYQNRVIDFRVILVKDHKGKWNILESVSRFGKSHSIISNISSGGRAELAYQTFRDKFHFSQEQQEKIFDQIRSLVLKSIKMIEAHGYHCGNIGFDIGIDKDLHAWIIEINNQNPDHYIALSANSESLFYEARYFNMLYAKKLAGF